MSAPAFGTIGTLFGAASSTPAFAVPASVASGDIIVVAFFADVSTTAINSFPTGFAAAENSPRTVNAGGATNNALHVAWKRASAADSGTYTFTLSASVFVYGNAVRVTGCVASGNPWDSPTAAGDGGATGSTTTPDIAVTTLGPDRLLFFVATNWNGDGGTWTPPSGFTERVGGVNTTNCEISDKVQATQGGSSNLHATSTSTGSVGDWLGALIGTTPGGAGSSDVSPQWVPGFYMQMNFMPAFLQSHAQPGLEMLPYDDATPLGPFAYQQNLTASLGFTASDTVLTSSRQSATVGFTGSLRPRAAKLLAAALSFTGVNAFRTSKVHAATVGFTGSLPRLTSRTLPATLSFTGALLRTTLRTLVASLAFTVTLLTGRRILQALAATLGFTGAVNTRTSRTQAATLSFTGALPRLTRTNATATIGFTGALPRAVSTRLTVATLSFTGALTRRTTRTLTATVSFAGTVTTQAVHFFTQALSATLSFTGTQTRATSKGVAATVGFTTTMVRRTSKAVAATINFTVAQTRRVANLGTATLSTTGALTRRTSRSLTATVGVSGTLTTLAAHLFTKALTATVGFTGTLTTSRIVIKLLTATVGMTGALTRRVGALRTATLSFTTAQTRTVRTLLTATLSFTAVWTRVPTLLSALSSLRDRIFGREGGGASGRRGPSGVSYDRKDGPIDGREDGT